MELRQVLITFGKNLEAFRKGKKLSQDGLAVLVGQKQSGISKYEKGLIPPGLELLTKLAEALGVSPADLLADGSRQISKEPTPEEALAVLAKHTSSRVVPAVKAEPTFKLYREFVELLSKADPDQLESIYAMAESVIVPGLAERTEGRLDRMPEYPHQKNKKKSAAD